MDKQPALKAIGGGLKCDNVFCDWIDMTIPTKDYKKWVNKPCPKCGCVVLTKQDYILFKIIHGLIKVINFVYFFIPKKWLKKKLEKKYGKEIDLNETSEMRISFDGSGKPIFSDIEKVSK